MKKILVLEDEANIRSFVVINLRRSGFEPIEAENGEMALEKLSEGNIVELDEERKAAMVSNLLVVLCGSKDAQPIVNSGSIY